MHGGSEKIKYCTNFYQGYIFQDIPLMPETPGQNCRHIQDKVLYLYIFIYIKYIYIYKVY